MNSLELLAALKKITVAGYGSSSVRFLFSLTSRQGLAVSFLFFITSLHRLLYHLYIFRDMADEYGFFENLQL